MIKTAESVSPKHPDKMCDRVSDGILDLCLSEDPLSRCAIEVMGGHGELYLTGEITSNALVDYSEVVSDVVGDIRIHENIVKQSPEIARGVNDGGAGDQGIMVGYACKGNDNVPLEVYLSRDLCRYVYKRYPQDGKTQVTVDDGKLKTVVISWCGVKNGELKYLVREWLMERSIHVGGEVEILANPAGDWVVGGFDADAGLTGRKLVVDNYGPNVAIGGGCFSGKDCTKVDRSGAYKARQLAVRYLSKYGCEEVYCWLAYAIGFKYPVMATVRLVGEEIVDLDVLDDLKEELTPSRIISDLGLRGAIFSKTAEFGHFGNGFEWDKATWTSSWGLE